MFVHLGSFKKLNIKRKVGFRAEFMLIHAVVGVIESTTVLSLKRQ